MTRRFIAALAVALTLGGTTGALESPRRDLSVDEQRGGHTLARHVGRTDQQLRQRLADQPNISAASTYNDRETAELTVGAILEQHASRVASWTTRRGSRPNLALRVADLRGQRRLAALDGRMGPLERSEVLVRRFHRPTIPRVSDLAGARHCIEPPTRGLSGLRP